MLVEIIKKIAEETQEELGPYRHRPSSVGKCLRALTYHASGIEAKPFPGRALLVFDDSSWHEELTADWIQKSAYRLHSRQMPVDVFGINGTIMRGSIDGILQDPLDNEYLWEHKAINHFSFNRIEQNPAETHDYIWQTCLYLYGLQQIQPGIKMAVLHIKNKNTANYLEYLIAPTEDWKLAEVKTLAGSEPGEKVYEIPDPIEDARHKFEAVDLYLKNGSLPERPYNFGDWHCDYCRWGGICWEGYEGEVAGGQADISLETLLAPDILSKIKHYRDTLDEINCMTKIKQELCKKILKVMREANIRSGLADGLKVERQLRHTKEHLVKASTSEMLSVKPIKGGEDELHKTNVD